MLWNDQVLQLLKSLKCYDFCSDFCSAGIDDDVFAVAIVVVSNWGKPGLARRKLRDCI